MPAPVVAEIPYRGYWTTPFTEWQGSLQHLNSVKLAAHTARQALAQRRIDASVFDLGILGMTIPQEDSFWGVPWLMSEIGAGAVGGPTIAQACATSARCLSAAAGALATGEATTALVVTCDRTSNGPVVFYPNPQGRAGAPVTENWVLDHFADGPMVPGPVLNTAENVARQWQITTEEQHDVVLRRHAQFQDALASDRAFQRRYMMLPFDVPDARFRKTVAQVGGDEGVHPTTREGLARLRPVLDGGSVTYGGQTHPADGNAAAIVTTPEKARELSADPAIRVRLRGFGQAREKPGFMPAAPILAARRALDAAGVALAGIDAIKSHNPFAVNDIVFARETGADLAKMNNFGCSLIYGHPQGPTGLRLIIELIEELAQRGGGLGLFHGCAAGDAAMSAVLEVSDGRA